MNPDDIPQVAEIERQSFPSTWPQTAYKRELGNPLARYFVLVVQERDCPSPRPPSYESMPRGLWATVRSLLNPDGRAKEGRILGFVGLWLMVGEAHVVTIAVEPAYRRQGLGEELLVTSLEAAIEEQQQIVTLECRRSNVAAQALYRKYGFRQLGIRPRYYTDSNEDAVIMSTDSIQAPGYAELLAQRREELRRRRGERYD